MATAWYTLVVGILITLDGIVFLIFKVDGFLFPNWYLGVTLITGVFGIILGMVSVTKNKKSTIRGMGAESNQTEEGTLK